MVRHLLVNIAACFLLVVVFLSACGNAATGGTQPVDTSTPEWTATASTSTSTPEWVVPVGSNPVFRAVHMDGNDGTN